MCSASMRKIIEIICAGKGLLSVAPENRGPFALYTRQLRNLWFASTREHRSNWLELAIFSTAVAGVANTAD